MLLYLYTLRHFSLSLLDLYVLFLHRYFLQDKDPNTGVFYGRHFKPYVKNGYMSGGAGYVLSKEALKVCVCVCVCARFCEGFYCKLRDWASVTVIHNCYIFTSPSGSMTPMHLEMRID